MKYLSLFLLCLSVVSCGKVPHDIDPYFNDLIQKFHQDADTKGVEHGDEENVVEIKFEEMPQNINGSCVYHLDKTNPFKTIFYKSISFNVAKFKSFTQEFQYKLFLHEVGHCMYHLSHDNSDALNIMFYACSSTLMPSKFEEEKKYYFDAVVKNRNHWADQDPPNLG